MAQNKIEIFDDSVLKLTVNQGTENERSSTTLGNFNMGELAFVRNTGRLFVGDCSDDETIPTTLDDGTLNYTKGGILTGNRYLGMIDSKPLIVAEPSEGANGTPLNYETTTQVTGQDAEEKMLEKPMLGGNTDYDAKFKRLNIVDNAEEAFRWDKKAQYNERYDAYDGDIAYDVYENALILFDKRITGDPTRQKTILDTTDVYNPVPWTTGTGETGNPKKQCFHDEAGNVISGLSDMVDVKYRTPMINLGAQGDPVDGNQARQNKVYGDGYVVFRNIEPDNDTIQFVPKNFNQNGTPYNSNKAGTLNPQKAGYSHNVLAVTRVPFDVLTDSLNLNTEQFESTENKINILPDLSWATKIGGKNGNSLEIPEKIKFGNGTFTLNDPGTISNGAIKMLAIRGVNGNFNVSVENPFTYDINLGHGLTSSTGKTMKLAVGEGTPTLMLDESFQNIDYGSADPYHVYDDEITTVENTDGIYIGEFLVSGGTITTAGKYTDSYKADAQTWIEKYASDKNVPINMLKKPLALMWTDGSGSACSVRANFYNGSMLFANKCDSKTGVNIFGSKNKTTQVIDLSKAVASGTKNALKYNGWVALDQEYTVTEEGLEILPTKIVDGQTQKIFEWVKVENEAGTVYTVSSQYTSDGDQVEVSSVQINGIEIMQNPDAVSDLVVATTYTEDDTTYTTYTIYADAKAMLKGHYSYVQFTIVPEYEGETPKTETVDFVKNGICKFVSQSMMNINPGAQTIGVRGDYKVVKSFTVNNDFSLTPVASMENWNMVLNKANGILYIATDPDIDAGAEPEYYYMYYSAAACAQLGADYNEPAGLEEEYQIRVPEHAKSVLLEVSVYNSSTEEEIAVFTSNLYNNLKNCTGTTVEKPYTYTSGKNQPDFNTGTASIINIGEGETKLLSVKGNNYTSVIEIPVQHDETTGRLQFCVRAGNIKPSTNCSFIINLIGYKL